MSNSWFQFKEFTIQQDKCGMKVSTDACIQGAWTEIPIGSQCALDIGTGTGVLALMLAQRGIKLKIDAIEQDVNAFIQAFENVRNSPFADNIQLYRADVTDWISTKVYDLILCNPPFFQKSLKGADIARNAARHAETLSPETLVKVLLKHLSETGKASIMWPKEEHELFRELAFEAGLFLHKKLVVFDRENSRISRIIGLYGKESVDETLAETLIIKQENGAYSEEFTKLLQPFYLHL
ncbi:MAG: methyltransferase [Chitinophagaceae bacterium]